MNGVRTVVLCSLLLGSGLGAAESGDYRQHRDRAHAALAKGDFKSAQKEFLQAQETLLPLGFKSPHYAESLAEVAAFYCERGQPYLSGRFVELLRDHYLTRTGTNSMAAAYACFLYGQIQLELHKFALAETGFSQALAIAEREAGKESLPAAFAKAKLGQVHVWMKQDEKAIGFLEPGLKRMTELRVAEKPAARLRYSQAAFLRPDKVTEAGLMLEYVLALNAVNRKEEGRQILQRAEQLLAEADAKTSPKFQVLKAAGHTLEARGDWAGAESHFYAAAELLWRNAKLSDRAKLRGHELVLEFHVRAGQDAKSSTVEGILFERGVPEDYLHELNLRCERLSYARDGGPHKRY